MDKDQHKDRPSGNMVLSVQANTRISLALSQRINEKAKEGYRGRSAELRRLIEVGYQTLYGNDSETNQAA